MLRENLKDSASILQNILNQTLEVGSENISLLEAVKKYSAQQAEQSDLGKTLQAFTANREPLEILIQELRLIADDLTVSF